VSPALFLRRHLRVAIAPRTQFQTLADPTQALGAVRSTFLSAHLARGKLARTFGVRRQLGLFEQGFGHHVVAIQRGFNGRRIDGTFAFHRSQYNAERQALEPRITDALLSIEPMSKLAFLFPGQGAQFAGMGHSLATTYPEAARVFEEADDALGFALSKMCFEGPEEALKLTENTQPALVAVSTAAYRVLAARGFEPDFVAGHSFGEYSALVAAGSLSFADAVRLVRKRGQYMQQAVPAGVGAMAALLKLPPDQLDRVLAEAAQGEVVTASNLNSPEQVVIAGHAGAVERAIELAKASGAKRAIPLTVSAPFHCSLMVPAQQRLKIDLDAAHFADLRIPLVNNWQARVIRTGAEARQGLYEQVPNPVRWTESMSLLASLGVTQCVEVGCGAVLTGLLRAIDKSVDGRKFGEAEDLEKLELRDREVAARCC
jgi:[acyl-carrier-protein] S-malonyltransferase